MGQRKPKRKKSPPHPRKKFDIREFGNTVKNLFRRTPQVKPINEFVKSNLAQSYKKFYLKHEQALMEIKVRKVEARYDPKRPIMDDRSVRRRCAVTPYKRSHSATRTVHDTEEFVEEMYNIYSVECGVSQPYPFNGNVDYPHPDYHKTVQGNFSQKDIPKMTRRSRHLNEQCTSMAFAAVVAAKKLPTTLWTPAMMDRLVVSGDRLHHQHMNDIGWQPEQCGRLCVDELQTLPHDTRAEWPVMVLRTKLHHGLVLPLSQDQREVLQMTDGLSLHRAVKECFDSAADGCVLTIGELSTAILRDPIGRPCLFDSHQNDRIGRGCCVTGKASLYQFETVEHLVDYHRQKYGASAPFNIVGLEVLARKKQGG